MAGKTNECNYKKDVDGWMFPSHQRKVQTIELVSFIKVSDHVQPKHHQTQAPSPRISHPAFVNKLCYDLMANCQRSALIEGHLGPGEPISTNEGPLPPAPH